MGRVAANLDVRLSTMTGIIDQLQKEDMVEQARASGDRRSFQVKLTAYGRRRYRIAHGHFSITSIPARGPFPPARQHILEFLSGPHSAPFKGGEQILERSRAMASRIRNVALTDAPAISASTAP